ncbi:hypothetical protein Ahy_B05g076410 [Arachis hypogaea]|uniref:Profilin n=1 Tax=Arachis hypogaea TaxID=3818 RepID=A0A444Z3K4_ARAHY|nr:hypothetical protein Ahy_B05g076410 [Arachis hypogaea]
MASLFVAWSSSPLGHRLPSSLLSPSSCRLPSWQTYVDDHLLCEIEGNHLSSTAIVGQDGSVWAQSSNFPQIIFNTSQFLSPKLSFFLSALFSKFIFISVKLIAAPCPYRCYLDAGFGHWLLKSQLVLVMQGPGGVTIKKTNQALIIGIYDEPMTPG